MASKSKRLKARAKKRRHLANRGGAASTDPYVDFVMHSSEEVQSLFADLAAEAISRRTWTQGSLTAWMLLQR